MPAADAAMQAAGAVPPAAALVLRLLRVDARRPASWLTAAAAVACGGWAAAAGLPAAIAAGGLLAVAAVGHLPADGLAARGPGWSRSLLVGMRAAWPGAGLSLAAIATAVRGGSVAAPLAGAVSATGAAVVFALLMRARCTEPVAASRALIGAGSAAAAALAARLAGSGMVGQAIAAGAAWGLAAASGVVVQATAPSIAIGSAGGITRHGRKEAGTGPAMASALAAMVTCYFLAPQFAWVYAVVAVGWFVAVAVPPATAAVGGIAGVRLRRSAAGRPAVPGSLRRAASGMMMAAGLLAWPAVVALVLPAVEGGRVGGPLAALAWLGGACGLLAVAAAAPAGRSEEARAFVLSLVALAVVAVGHGSLRLPMFSGFSSVGAVVPAGSGVERPRPSCKTPKSPQPSRSSVAGCGDCRVSGPRRPITSAFTS